MIKLSKTGINNVIVTLTEKEINSVGPNYKLFLTHCMTHQTINAIPIYDLSLYPERYNKFIVIVATLFDELTISEDTTLDANRLYFINGNITINAGFTLTIPSDTYIFQNPDYEIIANGTIINDVNIITDGSISDSNIFWVPSLSGEDIVESTYLFTLVSGFYDYVIKSDDETEILETGKLLVEFPTVTETPTTYEFKG